MDRQLSDFKCRAAFQAGPAPAKQAGDQNFSETGAETASRLLPTGHVGDKKFNWSPVAPICEKAPQVKGLRGCCF